MQPILTAIVGLVGVLVGSFVTQMLTLNREMRTRRLDALVSVIAASGRVIGAHERLYELFQAQSALPLSDERVARAMMERSEAHGAWRSARAHTEILFASDPDMTPLLDEFEYARVSATEWVIKFYRLGEQFDFQAVEVEEKATWDAMRNARRKLIRTSQSKSTVSLVSPARRFFGAVQRRQN